MLRGINVMTHLHVKVEDDLGLVHNPGVNHATVITK